jgi:hypothetical protein
VNLEHTIFDEAVDAPRIVEDFTLLLTESPAPDFCTGANETDGLLNEACSKTQLM